MCRVTGCRSKVIARGWCEIHYRRWKRTGDPRKVFRKRKRGPGRKKHGHASTANVSPEYRTWIGMRRRCNDSKHLAYARYGGRGIRVCARWQKSFENFLEDMGSRPSGLVLDRIDNDGDYMPKNCRWATRKEQARNQSTNRLISWKGATRSVAEWAERLGLDFNLIHGRLANGWVPPLLFAPAGTVRRRSTS